MQATDRHQCDQQDHQNRTESLLDLCFVDLESPKQINLVRL